MLTSRVAHVLTEPVVGIASVQPSHDGIAVDLRHDRSRRDGSVDGIAPDQARLTHPQAWNRPRIHQDVIRHHREIQDRAPHGLETRAQDVEAIDLGPGDLGDGHGHGLPADIRRQPLAGPARETFRVVQAGEVDAHGQHHGGGHHGPGEWPDAHLVDPGHPPRSGSEKTPTPDEQSRHATRLGSSLEQVPLEKSGQRPGASARVAPQGRDQTARITTAVGGPAAGAQLHQRYPGKVQPRSARDENGDWRGPNHRRGVAAEEVFRDAIASVGSHHDQSGAHLPGRVDELHVGTTESR